MNMLTFDIEEWALAKAGKYYTQENYAEFDAYLNRILDLLDCQGIKATFFCTGMMAKVFPIVVKLIQGRGHEIGCHSNQHTWMNTLAEPEAREDTHAAVSSLEQCIGQKVLSYRAPAFSIGERNKWMFEILEGEGIIRDSSVFPALRDFGGFPTFGTQEPCTIVYNGIELKEYPISMTKVMGKTMAYSGGGYFRFLPLRFVNNRIKRSNYAVCYFHINDFIIEPGVLSNEKYEDYFKEPGTLKNRYIRFIKSNIGKKGAWNKLEKLLSSFSFVSLEEADNLIDWKETQRVVV